jgi:hypothetical protein
MGDAVLAYDWHIAKIVQQHRDTTFVALNAHLQCRLMLY